MILRIGWIQHGVYSLWYGLGPPLLICGLGGLIWLAIVSWRQALLVGAFPAAYYLLIGRGHTVFVRYAVPLTPFLCVTAAVLIVNVARRIPHRTAARSLLLFATLAIAWPSVGRSIAFDRLISATDTRVLAIDWLEARRKPEDWVYQTPPNFLYSLAGMTRPARLAALEGSDRFVDSAGTPVTPQWIVVAVSPLDVYTTMPESLSSILARDYQQEFTSPATHGAEPHEWFDQQDQLFVPYVDFSLRERPGPEVVVFRHR